MGKRVEVLNKIKALVISYLGLVLMDPSMFPQEDLMCVVPFHESPFKDWQATDTSLYSVGSNKALKSFCLFSSLPPRSSPRTNSNRPTSQTCSLTSASASSLRPSTISRVDSRKSSARFSSTVDRKCCETSSTLVAGERVGSRGGTT